MGSDFEIEVRDGKQVLTLYYGQDKHVVVPEGVEAIEGDGFRDDRELVSLKIPSTLKSMNSSFQYCSKLIEVNFPKSLISYYATFVERTKVILNLPPNLQRGPNDIQPINVIINLLGEKDEIKAQIYIADFEESQPYFGFWNSFLKGEIKHFSEYDEIFEKTDYIVAKKVRVALCRLAYPYELLDNYRKMYVFYLRKNSALMTPRLIQDGDIEAITLLKKISAIPANRIDEFIELAHKNNQTEILASLIDYSNQVKAKPNYQFPNPENDLNHSEWEVEENEDGGLTICRYLGTEENLIIPAAINGKKVTRIQRSMGSLPLSIFYGAFTGVKSIKIEEGVRVIGKRAFSACKELKSVIIPASVQFIGKEAFWGCEMLMKARLCTGMEAIYDGTFAFCKGLLEVKMPISLKLIGDDAFAGCTELEEVEIPSDVKYIGVGAFKWCSGIKKIEIPGSVKKISDDAFIGCERLSDVKIDDGVEEISDDAFYGCDNLARIEIPASIKKISDGAIVWFSNEWHPKNLVVYSPKGSYAIEYFKRRNINFVET